ncbi:MAG: hypothetical protein L6Q26_05215 [Anaerolineales bacterium]|nr:hypothetical protein [Anaerolineales bacterium]NUQ84246.1 hypothetical protein [Anaerolineales bacterium]
MVSIEVISAFIGLVLTLMVFSYLIGDNLLFRVAVYLFIGVASGYAAAVIVEDVLLAKFQSLPLNDPAQLLIGLIPFFLAATLLAKLSPRLSWMGNFAMAVLVGVGAATAVGGALAGTLIPQAQASMEALNSPSLFGLVEGGVMLTGTILTLVYFQFGAKRAADGSVRRNSIFEALAWLGRIIIAVTFGVLFAGVYMAALTAMIERLSSMFNFVRSVLGL